MTPSPPPSPLTRLSLSTWALPFLALALLAIHLHSLGHPPLAGTEGHRIFPAREMLASGDFTVPTLFGRVYLMKPPMYLWTLAAFDATGTALGLPESARPWLWRLPSVLSHLATLTACFLFARRWFGPPGGSVAGLGFLLLVCLWQEARTADIDPLNTLLCTLTGLLFLELLLPSRRSTSALSAILWPLAASLALAAALLAKGPAVLPVLLAVLIGVPLALTGPDRWHLVTRLSVAAKVWPAILLSVIPVLWWRLTAFAQVRAAGLPLDTDGASEGASKLLRDSWPDLLFGLTLPPTLFIYALPVSVALVFAFHPVFRRSRNTPGPERTAFALALSVLTGFAICLVSGIDNERYAYVLMPLIAVTAGGVFPRLHRETSPSPDGTVREVGKALSSWMLLGSAVALTTAAVVLLFLVRKSPRTPTPIPTETWLALALTAALCVFIIRQLARGHLSRAAVALVLLAIMVAVPFAEYSDRRRHARSGLHAARLIDRQLPPNTPVIAGGMVRYQPEFFYYLNRPVQSIWRDIRDPARLPPTPSWLILDALEMNLYRNQVPTHLASITEFTSNKQKCYLVHYLPPPTPTSPPPPPPQPPQRGAGL